MIAGGPSVLFDAVALIVSEEGAAMLAKQATARDFVADAFAHCKFIGYTAAAGPLLAKAGVAMDEDEGLIALDTGSAATDFVVACRKLRLWAREMKVKL
jgi:catalase